jgi:hypothetical protein
MLTIERASSGPVAIAELAAHLHPDDAAELRAAGIDLSTALAGAPLQALRWHGELVALFGCVNEPGNDGAGIPWLLCTTALDKVPRRAMADISTRVVNGWRAGYSLLRNLVHRHNRRALRFVRWLGFTVYPQPCGPGGQFFLFQWRRDV